MFRLLGEMKRDGACLLNDYIKDTKFGSIAHVSGSFRAFRLPGKKDTYRAQGSSKVIHKVCIFSAVIFICPTKRRSNKIQILCNIGHTGKTSN